MARNERLTAAFEADRRRLHAIAYRMLGSAADADDALQEAWLRTQRADADGIREIGAWLTTVVSRTCMDQLRARRSRREDYVGSWLPEPVVTPASDPADEAALVDSVGIALLVVLESLAPDERLALVLHDVFGVPFDQLAAILDRSPAATRKLASRARQRVRSADVGTDAELSSQRKVVDAFVAAARLGDFERLLEVLHPGVELRTDVGSSGAPARPPLKGAAVVAEFITGRGAAFATRAMPVVVNGAAGLAVQAPTGVLAVVSFRIAGARVAGIDLILAPEKLTRVVLPKPDV